MKKLWGGVYGEGSSELADTLGRSIESDLTFWREDVQGSIAHARMLGQTGIISKKESAALVRGLKQILKEGAESLPQDVEDVHTAVEVRLKKIVGEVAGKLHTARSRNDQVATDTRLFLRTRIDGLLQDVKALQGALIDQASSHTKTVMPGVTHQQHAQPVTLAFHLLAHFWALQRHGWRLANLRKVVNASPLGSAALAGTSFPIDRTQTAKELGFDALLPNALDATSDRSYVLDALHVCSLLMLDLSRISQEFVLWSSPEFGWMSLPDVLTTGSSIMPQKRNPDMAELIRGRTGRAVGNYVALATTMKGLVLGYNRDTQEDKPPLFESLALAEGSLRLTKAMIEGATFNVAKMLDVTHGDFSTATDLADFLAKSGVPFRKAHETVGKIVRGCQKRGIGLEDLTPAVLCEIDSSVPAEAIRALDPKTSALKKESVGGSGSRSVSSQLKKAVAHHAADGFPTPY